MDEHRFTVWIRALGGLPSRRDVLRGLVSMGLGFSAARQPDGAEAKKKHRHTHKKKVTFNDFGCVNVGGFCKNDEQCCSGICRGKKDKRTCKAHDSGSCQAGQDSCMTGGSGVPCTTNTGSPGFCVSTTGAAEYCAQDGNCFACAKDADCVPICGPQAACIVCAACTETGGTACDGAACTFPP
jgi:hypothetical protein